MAEAPLPHPGRNEPCHCGSGKKYKHCCLAKDEEAERELRAQQAAAQAPPPADESAPRPTPPPRPPEQPWKRGNRAAPGPRRITTPRKVG
jgi:hypothetical protein